ncbi:MAG: nucleotide exchange factor GrpE [Paraprevotella sp.]|jgi:grpE|nr:nucleotide exchange factor GrpE [Paraprevotella sp.]MBP3472246.1 nucleotide exchange factor GrpE [Paraprevotella sp.]
MKTDKQFTEEEKNNIDEELNQEAAQAEATEEKTDGEAEEKEEAAAADPLEETKAKLAEMQDKYLRQVAEFDNYRKRTIKEKAELILNGGERTLTAILPVLDDFERALKNMEKAEDVTAVKEGVELIFQKFMKVMEAQGVKKIETENADFNTDLHEAIAQIPAPNDDLKGKVMDCVQTGYTLNDKVIRHAKVAVGL